MVLSIRWTEPALATAGVVALRHRSAARALAHLATGHAHPFAAFRAVPVLCYAHNLALPGRPESGRLAGAEQARPTQTSSLRSLCSRDPPPRYAPQLPT